MQLMMQKYDRTATVAYAHEWAFGRNPRFYNYENIGGDCTNFASQCLYAGSRVMNFLPTFGWYYINANQKSPSWTGVEYLFHFLTRGKPSAGPVGQESLLIGLLPFSIRPWWYLPNLRLPLKISWSRPIVMMMTGGPYPPMSIRCCAASIFWVFTCHSLKLYIGRSIMSAYKCERRFFPS